jgi:Nucleotidyl transferase AbiEii toxin, Type IV TA system
VLKGGVLLAAYDTRRPTHDIDLQATHLASDTDTVLAMVRDIAAVHKDDGLVYDAGNATVKVIRDEEEYSGVRVRLIGHLSRAPIPFHVDVNVDPIVPRH